MLRALFYLPVAFVLVLFALSNPQPVQLGIWPTDFSRELPLSVALLLASGVAFLLGALLLWFSVLAARLRARRAEHAIKLLESQVKDLKAKLEAAAPKSPAEIQLPVLTTN
jgi:uncharacterized integral membrane protein